MIKVVFVVVALFYALVGALGIWWLVYFNRKKVRDVFAGAGGQIVESRRPFLIALLAVFNLIGAAGCVLMALLPLPLLFLGLSCLCSAAGGCGRRPVEIAGVGPQTGARGDGSRRGAMRRLRRAAFAAGAIHSRA
jgi:hypothetical protein